jgi:hypothetical protein
MKQKTDENLEDQDVEGRHGSHQDILGEKGNIYLQTYV